MRRVTAMLLAAVGALLTVVGVVLTVADRSLFDAEEVERTTRVIVEDRDVARLLTREITTRVVELADLEDQRDVVEPFVAALVADDEVQDEVTDAVMVSYTTLVDRPDEVIDLNLEEIARPVRIQAVAVLPALDDELPPADELLRFELFHRSELPEIYDAIDTLRAGAWAVLAGGIIAIVAALALGPSRFAVLAVASGVAVAGMFLAVTWITTASDDATDAITDPLSRRVAHLAVEEYLADLERVAIGVVIVGIIGVIVGVGGTWVVNFVRTARQAPA
jgi:hypothetical protein